MVAYYSNRRYEDDPNIPEYPDYSSSRDYLNYQGTQGSPNYPGSRDNPDYLGSRDNPDYPGSRDNPDYPGSRDNPDYSGSRDNPDYPGSRDNPDYPGSRDNPDYPGSRDYPDYPGSRDYPDYPGSRDYPDFPDSRENTDFQDKPNYPRSWDHPHSQNVPNSLGSWNNPDYPDYPSTEPLDFDRRLPDRALVSHSASSRRNNRFSDHPGRGEGDLCYPESIPMTEIPPSSQHSVPYERGFSNPAYARESDFEHSLPFPTYNAEEDYGHRHPDMAGEVSSIRRRNRFQDTIDIISPSVANAFDSHKREQKLITTLASLSNRERMKAIQKLPMTLKEKKNIRNKVYMQKKKKKSGLSQLNCFTQCLYNTSWTFRRFKSTLSEFFLSLQLWQKTLKVIGGQFGTSILSYFSFLKWLLKFNIFSFIVNFSFITIPQCVDSKPNNLPFTGLELLTGAGYFQETVMYYGFYTNSTITNESNSLFYNMQLAYIFTIGVYFMICFFSLVFSMAKSFRNNFINPYNYTGGASRILCSWDFNITNDKAVQLKQKNLSTQIKENLSERLQDRVKLPLKKRMVQVGIHLGAWVLSTGTAAACCKGVYKLSQINLKFLTDTNNQAATLLLPFVVCCINFIVPLFYSFFGLVEKFDLPRHQVYVIVIRNIFLKISIIGILSYYWLSMVAKMKEKCWETIIGQDIYRLLLMDFVFSLLDSLVGEYVRRMVGTHLIKRLGVPEFDIARNVLDLIYTQTLVWIGLFFSPLLPLIQIITLFILFYVKKVSLMMNCQPPRKVWRASQMMTLFIFLLFFPSFSGVLCVLAITVWRKHPSEECGPFKGLHTIFHTISTWIETLNRYPSTLWVVWIYHNLITSVHFFFILSLFVLIITYLYLQIIEGRKIMILLLHEQIINEGKDKMFLLEKLRKLQETRNKSAILTHQSSEKRNADVSPYAELSGVWSSANKSWFPLKIHKTHLLGLS
uniref:Transmembrane channel-like protein n=1 Tax=Ornithorhynchus anatinus TaxID=9258 RepID=A0A6I8NHS9_ORNAN